MIINTKRPYPKRNRTLLLLHERVFDRLDPLDMQTDPTTTLRQWDIRQNFKGRFNALVLQLYHTSTRLVGSITQSQDLNHHQLEYLPGRPGRQGTRIPAITIHPNQDILNVGKDIVDVL